MLTFRTAVEIAKLTLEDNAETAKYITSIAGVLVSAFIVLGAVF